MRKVLFNIVVLLLMSVTVMGQAKMKKIASLPDAVYETSGLELYKGKYLITHNDGGHKSEIYVTDLKGELVKKINIDDTKNRDWEDLTQDDKGRLYIGDFGNNANEREKCQIYILPPHFMDKKKVDPKKITFRYEDQKKYPPKKEKRNYDCEAFFWKDGKLFLLTKCRTKPYTGESRIYELPATPGKHVAKYRGSIFLSKSGGWRFCSVTGADYNAETNTLAILTYSKIYLIRDIDGDNFSAGEMKSYALPVVKQREAICFSGKNSLYLTDELKKGLGGGNLYQVKIK